MERFSYTRALRRFWKVVVASIAVAIAAAWLVMVVSDDETAAPATTYEATIHLFSTDPDARFLGGGGLSDPSTAAEFVTIDPVPANVHERIDFPGTVQQLTSRVSASVDADGGGLLVITARAADPREASEISQTFAEELLAQLSILRQPEVDQQIEDLTAEIRVTRAQIESAEAAGEEVGELEIALDESRQELQDLESQPPDPMFEIVEENPKAIAIDTGGFQAPRSFGVRALIALALGLLGGIAIALLLGRFDTRIRTKAGAQEGFGVPVLAEVPKLPWGARDSLVMTADPGSGAAEAYRILAAEIVRGGRSVGRHAGKTQSTGRRAAPSDAEPRTLVITSAGPLEGKTTTAANLAAALGETGRRVLLLDCDFRRPGVHKLYGLDSPTPGLGEALESTDEHVLDGIVTTTEVEGVSVVPSGRPHTQPSELFSSRNLQRALDEAKHMADIVIVDTPPILTVSDAAFILPQADGVLLVARAGRTTTEVAARTVELLGRLGTPVLGVALNWAEETIRPKGNRSYYRRYPFNEPESNESNGKDPVEVATQDTGSASPSEIGS